MPAGFRPVVLAFPDIAFGAECYFGDNGISRVSADLIFRLDGGMEFWASGNQSARSIGASFNYQAA